MRPVMITTAHRGVFAGDGYGYGYGSGYGVGYGDSYG